MIDSKKVLIIGDGLLGSELSLQNEKWGVISRRLNTLNIDNKDWMVEASKYDIIVNCIANTDTYSKDLNKHLKLNLEWVTILTNFCNDNKIKLVHISTDYVYANNIDTPSEVSKEYPHNSYYGTTKLMGDNVIKNISNDYLLIRCGHKPNPFPYPESTDMIIGNFDYVDKISEIISKLINKNANGLFNVGTEVKTMHDLAILTNKCVNNVDELPNKEMPTNLIMDITKLKDFLINN